MRVGAYVVMSAQLTSLTELARLGRVKLESDRVDYHGVTKVQLRRED